MSHLRDFARSGHPPTLFSAFLYFDISFMVWVLLGPLGTYISEDLGLSPAQKGLLAAVPLLGGSLFRLILGPLADRYGGRRAGAGGLVLTLLPLLLGWLWADSLPKLLLVGLLLGVAGASFAVALPMASRWYPPEHQGLAMGLAGAGNSGTLIATMLAPRLAEQFGWKAVFGLCLLPVLATLLVFLLMAKDRPRTDEPVSLARYLAVLRQPDTAWFCLMYGLTFGGFVGMASFLSIFFRDQYGLGRVQAGDLTTLCVLAGSFLRPIGGYLADRLGGVKVLQALCAGTVLLLGGLAGLPPVALSLPLVVILMSLFGLGNGSVFQLVPQRFPLEIGVITGIIGAAGGLGGFFLPSMMGLARGGTGSFASGFVGMALYGLFCLLLVSLKARAWRPAAGAAYNQAGLAVAGAEPGPR